MSSKSAILIGSVTFIAVAILSFSFSVNLENSRSDSDFSRVPASSIEVRDGDLSDENLTNQLKARILRGLKVIEWKDQAGIELGGFTLNSANGEKIFACDEFPKIVLIFEGEGVAHSGSKPQMEVSGPCLESESGQIEALLIPNFQLAQGNPFQGEWPLSDLGGKIVFYNTAEEWPSAWALTGIYFENSVGVTQIEITLNDLIRWIGQPVGIIWPTGPISE
jgi:hypothetical protein